MRKVLFIILILGGCLVGFGVYSLGVFTSNKYLSPVAEKKVVEKPLEVYQYTSLKNASIRASDITLGEVIKDDPQYTSQKFYFHLQYPKDKPALKVSGLLNIPKKEGTFPIILMIRGYVDREKYSPGVGTQRVGEELAKSGYITLAPDFLGYGESDPPSDKPIEERFQTYVAALTLLNSIKTLDEAFKNYCQRDSSPAEPDQNDTRCLVKNIQVDENKVGIWGHSNGGQIALSVLEITGKSYPTVLWAPVSKPFPYSILYYTDEFEDHGKMLRKVVAEFEKDYEVEKYSLTNYLDWIMGPIQLHQGGADDAVPQKWSDLLAEELENQGIDIEYFTYPGADHNLAQGAWNSAVLRSIEFYRKHL